VGGGNSAGQAAVYLAGFARHVTLVVRGGRLEAGMSQYLVDQISALPGIEVRLGANVSAVRGSDELEAVTITDPAGPVEVPMQALFLFVGALPRTEWLGDLVERDGAGFIVTGPALPRVDGRVAGWPLAREPLLLETNVPGIFAAGDVRARSVKRIASGVGEGAMAVQFVHQHLSGN
jgi:thioredoxin reductase (NADPH)